jgi:hypothetical protein
VLDASLPVAVVSAPAGVARVRVGDEVLVEGSASGASFASYVLEIGSGDFPPGWTLVDRGSVAVPSGRLGSLTTALRAPGRYVLKLTVSAESGKSAVAYARLDLVDEGECR